MISTEPISRKTDDISFIGKEKKLQEDLLTVIFREKEMDDAQRRELEKRVSALELNGLSGPDIRKKIVKETRKLLNEPIEAARNAVNEEKEKENRIGLWGVIGESMTHVNDWVELISGEQSKGSRFGQLLTMTTLQFIGTSASIRTKENLQDKISTWWREKVGRDGSPSDVSFYAQEFVFKERTPKHDLMEGTIYVAFEKLRAMTIDRSEQVKNGVSIAPLKREFGGYTVIFDLKVIGKEIKTKVKVTAEDLTDYEKFKERVSARIKTEITAVTKEQSIEKATLDENDFSAADLRIQTGNFSESVGSVLEDELIDPNGRFPSNIRMLYSQGKLQNEESFAQMDRVIVSEDHSRIDGLESQNESVSVLNKLREHLVIHNYNEEKITESERIPESEHRRTRLVEVSIGREKFEKLNQENIHYVDVIYDVCKGDVYEYFKSQEGVRLNPNTVISLALMLALGIDHSHFLEKDGVNLVPVINGVVPALRKVFDDKNVDGLTDEGKVKIIDAIKLFGKGRFGDARAGKFGRPGRGSVVVMDLVSRIARKKLEALGKWTNPKGLELLTNAPLFSILVDRDRGKEREGVTMRVFSTALSDVGPDGIGVCSGDDGSFHVSVRAESVEKNLVYRKYGQEGNPESKFKKELDRSIETVIAVLTKIATDGSSEVEV